MLLGRLVALGRWYQLQRIQPQRNRRDIDAILVHVTNAGDRGPGTLREALFLVAGATGPTNISIDVPTINLETALPALSVVVG